MGGIMPDMQLIFHFINSCHSVVQKCGADSYIVLIVSGCRWSPWLFCISYACATGFKLVSPFSHNFALAKHCSHTVLKVFDGFLPLRHTSGHKNWITTCCFSLLHKQIKQPYKHYYSNTTIIQSWNSNTLTKCVCIYSFACN